MTTRSQKIEAFKKQGRENAKKALDQNINDIKIQIASLQALANDLEGRESVTWADVGDAAHVKSTLNEILSTFYGETV